MTLALPLSVLLFPVLAGLVYFPCLKGPKIFDDFDVMTVVEKFTWR